MASKYRTIFQEPGTVSLTVAGLLARMPLSMVGIGTITMVSATRGSYTLAGALAGTYAVSTAIGSPQIARLVDRFGQRQIIPIAAMVSFSALVILAITSASGGQDWVLFLAAAVAGITPSAPALVRARWAELHRGTSKLHTAFAWETVLDEASFILGPLISIGLSTFLFPQAGPLAAGGLLLVGALWLAGQRDTEPAVRTKLSVGKRLNAAKHRTVVTVTLIMVVLGVIIGTIDVVSVAFAEQQGNPAAASIVLSVYAVGSCASGFIFGGLTLKRPTKQLLNLGVLATAITVLPLLWVSLITTLSVAVLVSGIFFAPTMILAAKLIQNSVQESSLTEALTWSTAGLGFGTAIGPAIAGPVIDLHGASSGFSVAIVAAGLLLAVPSFMRTTRGSEVIQ